MLRASFEETELMPTNRPTLSMRDILDAARHHQREINDLVARLEYICGVAPGSPLIVRGRTSPISAEAKRKATAARKVAEATAMFHAATNGHAPAATKATKSTSKRKRTMTPPGVADAAILAVLKKHPRSTLDALDQRLDRSKWSANRNSLSMALHRMKAQRTIRADKPTKNEAKGTTSRFVYSVGPRKFVAPSKAAPAKKATRVRRRESPSTPAPTAEV